MSSHILEPLSYFVRALAVVRKAVVWCLLAVAGVFVDSPPPQGPATEATDARSGEDRRRR